MLFNDFFLLVIYCSAPIDSTQGKIVNRDMMRMMTLLGVGSFHMRTSTGNNNHIGGESFTNICMIAAI
jgi:hypothetical protein